MYNNQRIELIRKNISWNVFFFYKIYWFKEFFFNYIIPHLFVASKMTCNTWLPSSYISFLQIQSMTIWLRLGIFFDAWYQIFWFTQFQIDWYIGRMLYVYHHHHHQIVLPTQISLTLLVIRPYHPLLPAGPLDYILCPYRAVVLKFLSVSQHWHICVQGGP